MPTYVYECPNCFRQKEISRSIDERDDILICQECSLGMEVFKWVMKRIIAPTSFILKGPGWAKDGYSK